MHAFFSLGLPDKGKKSFSFLTLHLLSNLDLLIHFMPHFVCVFSFSQLKEGKTGHHSLSDELFESPVYLEEVSDVLYIALAGLYLLLRCGLIYLY